MTSIRRTLVLMLVAAFTLVSFLAALNGYRASMARAEQLLDTQLQYAMEILRSTATIPVAGGSAAEGSGEIVFQVWAEGHLQLQSPGAPAEPVAAFAPGLDYHNFAGYRWRTLTEQDSRGRWLMVGERADLRHLIAEQVVLEAVVPLLLWLPVAAGLIWVVVGWGLAPLRQLSAAINRKASDDLSPLSVSTPPAELAPLVAATNALLLRLAGALQREQQFAAHAAHELRTPISVLKVHLHNLAQELPAGSEALQHANAGVERMQHLVEQILDLSRTQPDLIQANFLRLDLHALARQVTADLWPAFAARQQGLSLAGEPAQVLGDPAMLDILLRNLLDNAGKYTPRGGEVQVAVEAVDGGGARLVVADSGRGVPAAERERVLERFYRSAGQEGSASTGAGLGLTIVQHITRLHHARLTLSEGLGGSGLGVTVEFPAPPGETA